jgi:hypothetical protein
MENENLQCSLCKTGTMYRNHVCEEYIVWICSNDYENCPQQDLESFYELDEEGWNWLREYYGVNK